jgi:hypothetical protein
MNPLKIPILLIPLILCCATTKPVESKPTQAPSPALAQVCKNLSTSAVRVAVRLMGEEQAFNTGITFYDMCTKGVLAEQMRIRDMNKCRAFADIVGMAAAGCSGDPSIGERAYTNAWTLCEQATEL